jgi:hypothetical protein
VQEVVLSGSPRPAAEEFARDSPLRVDDVLSSPYVLIGSLDAIAEAVLEKRERHGFSYWVAFEDSMDAFAPVVSRLVGSWASCDCGPRLAAAFVRTRRASVQASAKLTPPFPGPQAPRGGLAACSGSSGTGPRLEGDKRQHKALPIVHVPYRGWRRALVRQDPAHRQPVGTEPEFACPRSASLAGEARAKPQVHGLHACTRRRARPSPARSGGSPRRDDWDAELEHIAAVRDAGGEWWFEWAQPADRDAMRRVDDRGPLRVN